MPNRYFNNAIDLINNTRARASDVEANFDQLEDGFDAAQVDIDAKANSVDSALSGTPTAPTAAPGTNTSQIATTAFVHAERDTAATLTNKTINLANNTLVATSAQLAAALTDETGSGQAVFNTSPSLGGAPTAPTAPAGTSTTQLATTAFVGGAIVDERSAVATLTNKTLISPAIDGGTLNNVIVNGNAAIATQRFSGNGVTTTFNLLSNPGNENNTQVYINGVYQQKDTYSVSDVTVTFSEAPPTGTDNIEVVWISAQNVGYTSADFVAYQPAGSGAVASNVQSKLREFVSVKDFGAVGDGVIDDTAAIQAAIDSGNTGLVGASGVTVYFPPGRYKITDTLLLKRSGVKLLGAGFSASRIVYENAAGGVAVSGDAAKTASLNTYSYCTVKGIGFGQGSSSAFAAANDPDIYIDITSFSYSTFDVVVQTLRPNGVCIYGQGNNGASPYYNKIAGWLFGGVSSGTNYTQTGIKFAQGAWAGGSNGPNANMIGPIPRAAGLGILVDLQSGTGNLFNQISGESINDYYFRFNFNAAVDSGTSTGSNGQVTFIDTSKAWTSNAFTGDAVKITGGTGSGQVRMINTNSATTLTLREPWAVIPDATSTYEIYEGKAQGNRVSQCRAEGLASLNPDFIYAAPGTDKTEVDQSEVQALGSGLFVRDESGSPKNNWYSQSRIVMTENITNPGPSANIDLYNRLSVFGGVRFAGNYVVEWLRVATITTTLGDTLTARLDVGGTSPGVGSDMTLLAQVVTGQSQSMAMPTATQKILRDSTNRGVFVNVQTGAAFSATADATVTWCVTLV